MAKSLNFAGRAVGLDTMTMTVLRFVVLALAKERRHHVEKRV
jgi:hypothetical protein